MWTQTCMGVGLVSPWFLMLTEVVENRHGRSCFTEEELFG